MIWMLLGLGSMLQAGATEGARSDSVALSELRSRLPEYLRVKVEQARIDLQARHDTLSQLSAQERSSWLDSLRKEARNRRSSAMERLTPQERERVEAHLRQLERSQSLRSKAKAPSSGYRQ
jgi:hypothetical protein